VAQNDGISQDGMTCTVIPTVLRACCTVVAHGCADWERASSLRIILHATACTIWHLVGHLILFISMLVVRAPAYCPDFTCSQAAAAARPAPLGVVHAPSCRFVLQTCHSCVNAAAGSLECVTRFKLLACPPHFACRAGPHSDLPASSSRSHQIVTATSSE
jgi:hypothetical protein